MILLITKGCTVLILIPNVLHMSQNHGKFCLLLFLDHLQYHCILGLQDTFVLLSMNNILHIVVKKPYCRSHPIRNASLCWGRVPNDKLYHIFTIHTLRPLSSYVVCITFVRNLSSFVLISADMCFPPIISCQTFSPKTGKFHDSLKGWCDSDRYPNNRHHTSKEHVIYTIYEYQKTCAS